MRTHTLLTKCASIAVCFGVLLSGPVMAGTPGIIKDVELTKAGVLYGQVSSSKSKLVPNAVVYLRHQGVTVAKARSNADGRFAISGVRGGAHEVVVGAVHSPVRLWSAGAAPKGALKGIAVSAEETIIRAQNAYCDQCPPGAAPSNESARNSDVDNVNENAHKYHRYSYGKKVLCCMQMASCFHSGQAEPQL